MIRVNRTGTILCLGACVWLTSCQSETNNAGGAPQPTELFVERSAETGLQFNHFVGATGDFYLPEIMGPGVAVFDYDNDGDLDVYFLQGSILNPKKTLADSAFPAPNEHFPGNRLFRNALVPTGRLAFEDVTDAAGVGDDGYGLGAAVGDYDNDGDADLYVTNYGPNVLYRNNGDGTFQDVTREAGVIDNTFSSSAAFLDYDSDGDLDLYVAHYNTFSVEGNKLCRSPAGERDYCGPKTYFALPDRLYRNEGNGRFSDVTRTAGIDAAYGHGLGVVGADFNADGRLDIYVANDETPNQLWMQPQDGKFKDMGLASGSAYNGAGEVEAGMGVTAEDFDGDGDLDLFLSHLTNQTNTLYVNDGRGNFDDATAISGLGPPSLPFTGFGTKWFDYDNDGLLDLFVANGTVVILGNLKGDPFPYHQKNQLFRNRGRRYEDISASAGAALQLSEVSRGAAFGDIDNDGDVDIVVSNCNGPARLLLNEVGNVRHWLRVRLEGTTTSRDAAGALVGVERTDRRIVWRRLSTDGSYLSANDPRVHFGLGTDEELGAAPVEAIVVAWPTGERERWLVKGIDRTVRLKQGSGTPVR